MPGGSFLAGKAQTTHFSFFFSFLHSPSLHFRHTDTAGEDFFFYAFRDFAFFFFALFFFAVAFNTFWLITERAPCTPTYAPDGA